MICRAKPHSPGWKSPSFVARNAAFLCDPNHITGSQSEFSGFINLEMRGLIHRNKNGFAIHSLIPTRRSCRFSVIGYAAKIMIKASFAENQIHLTESLYQFDHKYCYSFLNKRGSMSKFKPCRTVNRNIVIMSTNALIQSNASLKALHDVGFTLTS